MPHFKCIPQKIKEGNNKIKPKEVVKGLNWSSVSPRMEGDAASGKDGAVEASARGVQLGMGKH